MKRCNNCLKEKHVSEFFRCGKSGPRSQKLKATCRTCANEKRRLHVASQSQEYRDRLADRNKQRRRRHKLKAIEYCGSMCQDCGGEFPPCAFDFHHIDPDEKEIRPGVMWGRAWENILAELEKCVLLCANCHRIRHHSDSP